MAIQLEALDGKSAGRLIPVEVGRPRVFKVVKQGREAGSVTVEMIERRCIVTNRSERPLLVNGQERVRSFLTHHDTLVIGKDSFRLIDDEEAAVSLTEEAETRRISEAHRGPGASSGSLEVVEPDGPQPFRSSSSQDSDRHRRRKSISASMHSQVDQPKQTILNRVSSVFSARARTDRGREDELQKERQHLLEEVGRQVLAGHALGLPDRALGDLMAGERVTIDPSEVSRAALTRWYELAQRVALLDAEIAAVRRSLGLGPDLGAVRLTAPHGREQLRQQEERVFATLDALTTQELGPDPLPVAENGGALVRAPQQPAEGGRGKPAASGRGRVSGRRRSH